MSNTIKVIISREAGDSLHTEEIDFSDLKIANQVSSLINSGSHGTTARVETDIKNIKIEYMVTVDESIRGGWNISIDDKEISDEVFNEQRVDYIYEDRADLIENIKDMRCGASDSDKLLMDEDIQLLLKLNDNYVFSSVCTNEYISSIEDTERFNEICSDILEANKTLEEATEEVKVIITNVDWDGIEGFEEPIKMTVPAKTFTDTKKDEFKDVLEEYISDELSNISGFCHKSFKYEISEDSHA